ncbi:MAG: DinB family protein [Betaproteobacteria bacterium]
MNNAAQWFTRSAYNNAWANHRLLKACAQLSAAEFGATRTSFFPSLVATLNHLLTVDWFYVDARERAANGQPPHPQPWQFSEPETPFADCAALTTAQHAVDRRLIDLCRHLTDADLDRPAQIMRRAGPATDRIGRILAHLFQHQIHHRGQAHAMLAGTAVAPPQLDEFFCSDEAALRAADFAELGFCEEEIWGSPAPTL